MIKNNNYLIKNILVKYKKILKDLNFDTYSLDVDILLMNVTNFSKTDLYLNTNYELSEIQFEFFEKTFNRRLKKEPIAYILGKWEFMGLEFLLNKDTLIPRPETEILVEQTLEIVNNNKVINILDMCTGSGAIAVSIAKYSENKNIKLVASDINKNALLKAEENAKLNNINNIEFIESDLFNNLEKFKSLKENKENKENKEDKEDKNLKEDKFDIIVSNPPYIRTNEIFTLEDNVKNYEPTLALDGGENGLIFYEKIIKEAKNYLNEDGYILFEIGYDQAHDLRRILLGNDFRAVDVIKDLSNLERVVMARV